MRILVFMSHGLIARNFESALCELEARGHRIHVALDHMDTGSDWDGERP